MASYTEGALPLEFLIWEGDAQYSREQVTIVSGTAAMKAGRVLGKITKDGTATSAAYSGNTGNGTMGTVTVGAGAKVGDYKLTIVEPGTNVGNFVVEGPDGLFVGQGDVAAAFSAGGLSFTLADGSTDFVAGDGFTITVVAGSGKYANYDNTATNGTEVAAAILAYDVDASAADVAVTAFVRFATVKAAALGWGANDSTGITAGTADLAALNPPIIAR